MPGMPNPPDSLLPPVFQPGAPAPASNVRWVIGWAGTWFALAAIAEIQGLDSLAAALALAIAAAGTVILGPQAFRNLGGLAG